MFTRPPCLTTGKVLRRVRCPNHVAGCEHQRLIVCCNRPLHVLTDVIALNIRLTVYLTVATPIRQDGLQGQVLAITTEGKTLLFPLCVVGNSKILNYRSDRRYADKGSKLGSNDA
jgi:hypothetical protein